MVDNDEATSVGAPHPDDSDYEVIKSNDAPVPRWLIFNYIFWPLWGIVWFYYFWNGSYGWLDRGYWQQLQRAANTTIPFENVISPETERPHSDTIQKTP